MSSADNLCKQFRPRSDPTGMIWIQTAWHSTNITHVFRKKQQQQKSDFEKKYQQTTKPWQITLSAKRVDELKWKVLHVHAGFMLPSFNTARSRTHMDFYKCVCACVCVCVKVMTNEVCWMDFRWISGYRYSCRLVYIIIVMQIYHVYL